MGESAQKGVAPVDGAVEAKLEWRRFSSLIRFSHTVFALPFALLAAWIACDGQPQWWRIALVLVAMVGARSAAMAYNRYADRDVDAQNPRTSGREIPSGALTPRAVFGFTVLSCSIFVAAAFGLGWLTGALSVPTLLFLLGYSHAKRFTAFAQLWLGVALGLAAPAAWLAMKGAAGGDLLDPCLLGLGVAFWVAGFDAIYACQDEGFDRKAGLHSLPSRFGRSGALQIALVLHVLSIVFLVWFGARRGFGLPWGVAVMVIAGLLVRQQILARRSRGEAIDPATFAGNGAVGFVALIAGVVEISG